MNNPPRVPLDHRLVNPKAPHDSQIPLIPPSRKENTIPPPRNMEDPGPRAAPQGAQGPGYFIDTKGGGKGKRQPYEMASRAQPTQKSVRGGDTTPSPWTRSTMSMPTPPGTAGQSSSATPSAPKPLTELTYGEAGVPGYTGETIRPLTRIEAIKHYNAYTSRPLTTLHKLEDGTHYFEPLADNELTRILTKLPNEVEGADITQYKRCQSSSCNKWTNVFNHLQPSCTKSQVKGRI